MVSNARNTGCMEDLGDVLGEELGAGRRAIYRPGDDISPRTVKCDLRYGISYLFDASALCKKYFMHEADSDRVCLTMRLPLYTVYSRCKLTVLLQA